MSRNILAVLAIGISILSTPSLSFAQTTPSDTRVAQIQEQIRNLQAQLQHTQKSTDSCLTLQHNLSAEETDATTDGEVSQLQKFLGSKVTGYFGPLTERAVKQWQAAHHVLSSGTPESTGYGYVGPTTRKAMQCAQAETPPSNEETATPIGAVSTTDHITGNPHAPVILVEYSDYECPFCKLFHETLEKVMTTYGPSGKVAWVFRHAPITSLHPNAEKIAEASECVSETGGDFWKFSHKIFSSRKLGEFTTMSKLPIYAASAGANKAAFQKCLASGKYAQKIADSVSEFTSASEGGGGTPTTFLVSNTATETILGAQPYGTVTETIDALLSKN